MELRMVRHTSDLNHIKDFYEAILGFRLEIAFKTKGGYMGVIMRHGHSDWCLEFIVSQYVPVHTTDEDDLIVLYYDSQSEYNKIIETFNHYRIREFAPLNPYWEDRGKLYKDPDGFRVMICLKG